MKPRLLITFTTLLAVLTTLLATPSAADTLELTGILRDFKRGDRPGGHPDFETCQTVPGHGKYGLVPGLVTMHLSQDGKPVYNPTRPSNDSIASQASFDQWYRDVPGVNLSIPYTIILSNGQTSPGGIYTYQNSKFFPIDGQLFGNEGCKDSSGKEHNYHFTFELHNTFNYRPGQRFKFTGDDDVWVYINGVKVIDIGGVHSAVSSEVLLFDGKAFVDKNCFPLGELVKEVTTAMATQLAQKWTMLGLPGSCPIVAGARYIDLQLNGGAPDILVTFAGSQVTVRATADLSNVVLKFADGTVQKFDNLNVGYAATFSGTGAYAGKEITGVWVKTKNNQSGDGPGYGTYFGADGSGGTECTLDFFFAERHTVESNFRIDTSINLKPKLASTVSPLYD